VQVEIVDVASTELFVGAADAPEQVVRVTLAGRPGEVAVGVDGATVRTERPVLAGLTGGEPVTVEVAVRFAPGPPVGATVDAVVTVLSVPDGRPLARAEATLTVAEPGWTMFMVPHFHYDPVWWTTQAAYTSSWDALDWAGSPRMPFQHAAFDLVRAHLELTRTDPDYRFVLAETDYLKPYWDSHPEDRGYLRRLLAEGRCELMGGTYNEPNTNLTSAETTIRNAVYGIGLQRDVFGGDPRTAWQLDAFGHDPQFPGLMADAGLTSSSWARGPYHQWGPLQTTPAEPFRDARAMQFPSEFEWVAPSGRGLLTSYMPAHYSAGWWMDSAPTLAEAEAAVYRIFLALKAVAATRHVLLPVGTDYSRPNRWVTDIHRDWAARYAWPRFVCAVPRDFFAAVRAELDAAGRRLSPQTRDMNPIYTGKDVSYIDTKLAQRQAETLLLDAERFATLAALHGARYPAVLLDKAWRQLVYGAHHDAITGSESDQVYIDLLSGWREARDIGRSVRDAATAYLAAGTAAPGGDGRVLVFNGMSWPRTDLVRVRVAPRFVAPGLSVVDDRGTEVPVLAEGVVMRRDGTVAEVTLTFLAADVPATGYRGYVLRPEREPIARRGWRIAPDAGPSIANERYRVTVDPARGGCVSRLQDVGEGLDVLPDGQVGNELLLYAEYPQHPRYGEGPWHLLPTGPPADASGRHPARVHVETGPLGSRIVVRGGLSTLDYTQVITLWDGLSRLDCVTHVDDFRGSDRLLRLRWPTAVRGGLPVSEVGNAVIGRGFGIVDVDTAEAPWTLDNPAYGWFGVGSTARVRLADVAGGGPGPTGRAIGVAEVVADAGLVTSTEVRDLVVALVRAGVTSTTSVDTGSRYGHLDVDSNLPDVRIALGGPDRNAFTERLLDAADPGYAAELRRQLAAGGRARVWVPAERPLAEVWVPNADLRAERALPVLVVAGRDEPALRAELAALVDDLADATVEVRQPAGLHAIEPGLDDASVAILNRGLPGFAVDRTGALHLSLLRSCTGWPSGVWIDEKRRVTPDGSGFQLQHWSHTFEYALVSGVGDWRDAGFVRAGHAFNHPLTAVVDAGLLASGSLLSVEPPGAAVVTAVKPAGNPHAESSAAESTPLAGVTVRLYEPHGRPARPRLRFHPAPSEAFAADLLERPGVALPVAADGSVTVPLEGAEIATVVLMPAAESDRPQERAAGDAGLRTPSPAAVPLVADAEPAQPLYARYWLHNTGPAPAGNLPITVRAEPTLADGNGPFDLRVTVASSYTDANWAGLVRVGMPDGWTAAPAEFPLAVAAGGVEQLTVRVSPARDAPAGDHVVGAAIALGDQAVEDVVTVRVPGAYPGAAAPGELDVMIDTPAITLRPGDRTFLRATLVSRYRSPVHAVAHLVGPVDTWDLTPQWVAGVRVDGDSRAWVDFPVAVPADTRPGSWWLLVKLMYAGRVRYTESVRLTVDPPRR
jgi:alpha-mannosidase